MSSTIFHSVRDWYRKHERHLSTWALLFGFVFDSLTLGRIDSVGANLWLGINLAFAASLVVYVNKKVNPRPWLLDILQFSFGNLLGGFFIFYFRSATLAAAWPFLLLLLGAMVANELFQKRYARLAFQVSFLYLIIYTFAIYLVPIFLHRIGSFVFILSGVVSLGLVFFFGKLLQKILDEKFGASKTMIVRSVAAIFIAVNFLYFTNLIPPIPLSLKDAGVYYNVSRDSRGKYLLEREDKNFWSHFHLRERVRVVSGQPLYAYSAIFSPASLNTRVVHEWQYKDKATHEWRTASRITLSLSGGRGEGYRTFSIKESLTPGLWRVNVATPQGQLIGRVTFLVVPVETIPKLEVLVKE